MSCSHWRRPSRSHGGNPVSFGAPNGEERRRTVTRRFEFNKSSPAPGKMEEKRRGEREECSENQRAIPSSERGRVEQGRQQPRQQARGREGVIEARMWAWRGMATHPIFITITTTTTTTITSDAPSSELPCSCLPSISSYSASTSCNPGHSISSSASHPLTSQPICSPADRMVRASRFHLTLHN